jgi:hypothetical protein
MSYSTTRPKAFQTQGATVYLKAGQTFSIWLDSGRVMNRLTLDQAVSRSVIHYEEKRFAFGGDEYAARIILRTHKAIITIDK